MWGNDAALELEQMLLTRRPEELFADHAGCQIGFGVEPPEVAQAVTVVEKPGVEKIRCLAARLRASKSCSGSP